MSTAVELLSKSRVAEDDPSPALKDVQVPRITLNGKALDVGIEESIIGAELTRTIKGASTLELVVHDPKLALLQSGIFNKRVIVVVDRFVFILAQVRKQGSSLRLVFEDRDVVFLRRNTKPRKALRGKVTRAEFALSLIREIKSPKIKAIIPELHQVQRVAKPQRTGNAEREEGRAPGLDAGANVTVKGVKATSEQRSNIERVIDVGFKRRVAVKVLQAAVVAIVEETEAKNLTGGDRDSVGILQQRRSQGWPASRNIEKDVAAFYDRAVDINGAQPNLKIYELAHEVQRNYDTATRGQKTYGRWVAEAKRTVEEYLGGTNYVGTVSETGKFEFFRGRPGERETTWAALQRLADEVQWRCFATNGKVYFVSDEWLIRQKVKVRINPDTLGVLNVDFDFDVGKKVATAQLTCRAGRWFAAPGMVVVLERFGPANGRYLVESIRRPLFSADCEIILTKPLPELPEPSASESSSVGGDTVAGKIAKIGSDGKAIPPEDAPEEVRQIIAAGNRVIDKPYSQKAPRTPNDKVLPKYDCSSSTAHALCGADLVSAGVNYVSGTLAKMFKPGKGEWVTIYANDGHVFMEVAGIRFDTSSGFGGGNKPTGSGPRWRDNKRPTSGFQVRHPEGL